MRDNKHWVCDFVSSKWDVLLKGLKTNPHRKQSPKVLTHRQQNSAHIGVSGDPQSHETDQGAVVIAVI